MGFRDCVIHTAEEIERIRVAAAKTAEVRDQLAELVRPGMTTLQIDILAGELIHATGGTSAVGIGTSTRSGTWLIFSKMGSSTFSSSHGGNMFSCL